MIGCISLKEFPQNRFLGKGRKQKDQLESVAAIQRGDDGSWELG